MTNIKLLINDLRSKNISLSLENDNLKLHAPKGVLNKNLIKQISENKKQIIDLLKSQQNGHNKTPWMAEKMEFYEASISQKRMFLLQQIDKKFTVYNIPFVLEINGELEINKIKNAFNVLIENHEILRTYFKQIDGKIYQFIDENLEIDIEIIKAENKNIQELIKSIIKPVELTELPLLNIGIIQITEIKQILVVNLHHILIDAISIRKIINNFVQIYSGNTLPKELLQYKDFSSWTHSEDYQKILEKSKKYWLKKFDNEIPNLELPYDFNRPEIQSFKGDRLTFEIDFHTKKRVDKFVNEEGVTSFVFYISVYYLLLNKLTNQEDIILGAPINGRIKKEYEGLIGLFINTIALRNHPVGEKTYIQFLNEVKVSVLEAIENESYPFEDLLDSLKLNRDLGRNPLFNIMFSYLVKENSARNKTTSESDNAFKVNNYQVNQVKFDIDIQGFEEGNKVVFVVDYSTDLFKESTVLRFLKYYQNIILEILDNKSVKLKDIEFIEHDEKLKLLFNLNNTNTLFPKDKTIVEIFESEINNNFDKTALVFNDEQISYGELNKRANQLAFLLRSKGIEQNSVVGLFLDRSIEMIIGIIATLKSGGAYLPIDSGFPSNRIKYMINDSGTKFLVSKSSIIKDFSYTNLLNYDSLSQNVCKTNSREPIKVLDSMPFADRSLIDCEKYNKFIGMAMMKNAVSIQATRGCPYKCLYCHKIWPKSHYVRSAENIFEEVKMYYDMGVKRFAFIDDIFNLRKKNSERFFNLIIEHNLNIQISFPNGIRGDILTPDYIDLMVEAGTINMAIALETASPRIQKLIKKNINLTRLKENMEYIASKHPHVLMDIFTMHGFPTETEDEALKTFEFIKSIKWLHFPYFHILKVYPNTDMADLAMENGISSDLIAESVSMAYHELPNTLPFEHSFTKKIQAELLENYILNKERLLHVLPHQMRVLTKNELVQKYDSYLPIDIKNYDELLKYLNVSEQELSGIKPAEESCYEIENYNLKLANTFGKHKSNPGALKVLLLDLSQNFSNSENMLYDVVEPPLGLIYLLTNLNKEFGGEISGKIAKSRIDFDSYDDLRKLI